MTTSVALISKQPPQNLGYQNPYLNNYLRLKEERILETRANHFQQNYQNQNLGYQNSYLNNYLQSKEERVLETRANHFNHQNPQSNPYGLHNQTSQRFVSVDSRNVLLSSNSTRPKKTPGIPNFSNTCFAGALLQCLYHLPTFKKELKNCAKDLPKEIAQLIQNFFSSMDLGDSSSVSNSAYRLITRLFDLRPQEVCSNSIDSVT